MLVQFDTGNWLYVLLGIAWVAYSIYKGANKNQNKTTEGSNKERKKTFLDDLIEGFSDDENIPYADAVEPVADNNFRQENEMDTFTEQETVESAEENFVNEGVPVTKNTMNKAATNSESPRGKRKKKRINLKKAVIYSEILRRPYE